MLGYRDSELAIIVEDNDLVNSYEYEYMKIYIIFFVIVQHGRIYRLCRIVCDCMDINMTSLISLVTHCFLSQIVEIVILV